MDNLSSAEKELIQKLEQLPVTGEDKVWDELKLLLDEEDNNRRAGWLPGISFWSASAILLMVLAVTMFFVFRKNNRNIPVAEVKEKNIPADIARKNNKTTVSENEVEITGEHTVNTTAGNMENKKPGTSTANTEVSDDLWSQHKKVRGAGANATAKVKITADKESFNHEKENEQKVGNKSLRGREKRKISREGSVKNVIVNAAVQEVLQDEDQTTVAQVAAGVTQPVDEQPGSNIPAQNEPVIKNDTVVTITDHQNQDTATAQKKQEKTKGRGFYWSAGIAEQQSIGLQCKCAYIKPTVTDYLPSVYVRFHKDNKWFVQAEYKYSAPQYLDEFLYERVVHNKPLNIFTDHYSLKKVHYHQLPVSFNYVVLPKWSIGVGVRYNIFSTATSQVELRKNIFGQAQDSLVSSEILTNKNDSGFVQFNNYLQALFETQYQWKRFSIGARYLLALQPYIKYDDPYLNTSAEKRSNAVDIFIRYDLWRSKKHE